jgi:ferrochelatase
MKQNQAVESRKGAILINVGTPKAPHPPEVREYLKEFLMDPYVIDVPHPLRWLIVNGTILPKRPIASAEAYRKVWTDQGSPLLVHLMGLTQKVQSTLGDGWLVQPAMRYGEPKIETAFLKFKEEGVSEVSVFPLYPQYSLAATETSLQECRRVAKKIDPKMKLRWVKPFYDQSEFIGAFADTVQDSLRDYRYDHLLFSFHGLPERQVKKTDVTGQHCLKGEGCCSAVEGSNRNCYRAQCFHTARTMAQKLGLKPAEYTVCFQSRLGSTPWIRPFTDDLYQELPKRGVKRLGVVCPAFVADCLETLEEIQIRGKEDFIRHGGEDLKLVPSLNSRDSWAQTVSSFLSTAGLLEVL